MQTWIPGMTVKSKSFMSRTEPDSGWVFPDWQPHPRVRALVTTRAGGVSEGSWAGLNLGAHVGDDCERVLHNRALLRSVLPAEPVWLNQVHGVAVVDAATANGVPDADASVAFESGVVCVVMTADCLPVLFADDQGTVVAAAHAGWKGLLNGVLEETVVSMGVPPSRLSAWMGPAIGPNAFEVGDEVRRAFVETMPSAAGCFKAGRVPGKWMADLFALARLRLEAAGVKQIAGGGDCTFSQPERYFSYRRDRVTGRMASLVWLEPAT